MRSKTLWFGIIWTLFIVLACLIEGESVPKVSLFPFEHKDKVAHFFFYFVFTIVWFWHNIVKDSGKSLWIVSLKTFLIASLIGCSVEIAQYYLTTSRSAEWLDVLANTLGSICGLIASVTYLKILKIKRASSSL